MAEFSLPPLQSVAADSGSQHVRTVMNGIDSESVFRKPHPRLEGIVLGEYQGWRESSHEVVKRREVPACLIPFIINFGNTFSLVDPAHPARLPQTLDTFVAGIHDSFVIVESSGDSCSIQVNFTPFGARLFFQLPLNELANRSVALSDLYGDKSARVVEILANAPNWDHRFDILDTLIASRVATAKPIRAEVGHVWGLLQKTTGNAAIGDLASDVGWSHKHLINQCRDQLGAPPKLLGRLIRLEDAIKRIGEASHPRWVELAVDSGYFDQSHMIREFQRLAGCTPEEYLGLQLPIGGVSADANDRSEKCRDR